MINILKFDENDKKVFLTSIFFALVTHYFVVANNLYTPDAIAFNIDTIASKMFLGGSFVSGRWGIGLLNSLFILLGYTIKVPSSCVLIAILLLSFSNIFLFRLLDIRNNLLKIISIAATVVTPSLVNTYYFGFSSHVYTLSILFAYISVYLIIKTKAVILPVIFMTLSMSIYQASISIIMCLAIICIFIILQNDEKELAISKIVECSVSFIISFVIYYLLAHIFIYVLKIGFINDFYGLDGSNIVPKLYGGYFIKNTLSCYGAFISLVSGESVFAFNETGYATTLNLLFFIVSLLSFIVLFFKSNIKFVNKILSILLILIFPIAVNVIFIMTDSKIRLSEARVVYSYIFYFIFSALIIDYLVSNFKLSKVLLPIFLVISSLILCDKIILAHHSYYNLEKQNEDLKNFCLRLSTQIMSMDGYDKDKKVLILGRPEYDTNFIYDHYIRIVFKEYENQFNLVSGWYQDWTRVINFFAGANFKSPEDRPNMEEYYKYSKDVVDMPSYPAKGSIKIVDDYIVVKFRDFF